MHREYRISSTNKRIEPYQLHTGLIMDQPAHPISHGNTELTWLSRCLEGNLIQVNLQVRKSIGIIFPNFMEVNNACRSFLFALSIYYSHAPICLNTGSYFFVPKIISTLVKKKAAI